MNVSKFLTTALGIGMACAVLAPGANAQIPRERTMFAVTEPTEVGTTVLQPGTYLIKVKQVELDANRNYIQVLDKDGNKVVATALCTPHPRTEGEAIPESEFMFYPASASHPRALRTWFASGTMTGQDIVYSKERQLELAQVEVTQPVTETAQVVEQKQEVAYQPPPPAPQPETLIAEAKPPEPAPQPEELPRTAGELPLVLGLGLVWLAGAMGLRLSRRQAV